MLSKDDPEKRAVYNRAYYARNRQAHIDRAKARRKDCVEYVRHLRATTPCLDCGVQYPWYVMEFDHRDSSEMVDRVSNLANTGSRLKLLAEIEKCDLVCANCHKIRTHERRTLVSGQTGKAV